MAFSAPISFKLGASKRPTINQTTKPIASEFESINNNNDNQREEISELDDGKIKSNLSVKEKPQVVIPCPGNDARRFHKVKPTKEKSKTESEPAIDDLDIAAKQALLLDADQANKAWDERNENGVRSIHAIEAQTSNTFTARLENNEQTVEKDDDSEEKVIENPDYELISIDDFGMGVMLGMGYKEGAGIGTTNKKAIDVFVPECRPRGLGLGADRKVLEKLNSLKRKAKETGIDEKDDLCMEKGAFVQIEKGEHTDQYGTVESIDEDVSRLTIALAIGGTNKKKEVISISQFSVRLVTEKEFLKYSKYVNKSKAEQVEKETAQQLMKTYHKPSKHDDDEDQRRHKHHKSSKHKDDEDEYRHRHSKHRHDDSKRSRRH